MLYFEPLIIKKKETFVKELKGTFRH